MTGTVRPDGEPLKTLKRSVTFINAHVYPPAPYCATVAALYFVMTFLIKHRSPATTTVVVGQTVHCYIIVLLCSLCVPRT